MSSEVIRIGLKLKKKKRTEKVSESEQTAGGEDMMSLLLYLTKGPDLIKP